MISNKDVKDTILSLCPPSEKTQLTDAEIEAFASQKFVQQALESPSKPQHVLSFFFVSQFPPLIQNDRLDIKR